MPSTPLPARGIVAAVIVTTEIGSGQLAELVKQVQAGNVVLLTEGSKPVAELVPAGDTVVKNGTPLRIRSLSGHRVLTPVISQDELADEMFGRR